MSRNKWVLLYAAASVVVLIITVLSAGVAHAMLPADALEDISWEQ